MELYIYGRDYIMCEGGGGLITYFNYYGLLAGSWTTCKLLQPPPPFRFYLAVFSSL